MHPGVLAAKYPVKPAYIMAESGEVVSYQALDDKSNQAAQLFRKLGLKRGDHIAILLENHPCFIQICLAAERSGLHYTAISYRLQEAEVEYIVNDCQARVFITSIDRVAVVEKLQGRTPKIVGRRALRKCQLNKLPMKVQVVLCFIPPARQVVLKAS